ncbi:hypothetical protein [Pyruvatibacter mobilis]
MAIHAKAALIPWHVFFFRGFSRQIFLSGACPFPLEGTGDAPP